MAKGNLFKAILGIGGAAPNNNLRIVTEEDLKKNKNALSDKE